MLSSCSKSDETATFLTKREDKGGETLLERRTREETEMGFERRRMEDGLRGKSLILGLERDRVLRVEGESVKEVAEADMASEILR